MIFPVLRIISPVNTNIAIRLLVMNSAEIIATLRVTKLQRDMQLLLLTLAHPFNVRGIGFGKRIVAVQISDERCR
jgi:hypothetical protein